MLHWRVNRGGSLSRPDLLSRSSPDYLHPLTVILLLSLQDTHPVCPPPPCSTLAHVPFGYRDTQAPASLSSLHPSSFLQTSVKSSGTSMIAIVAKRTPVPQLVSGPASPRSLGNCASGSNVQVMENSDNADMDHKVELYQLSLF